MDRNNGLVVKIFRGGTRNTLTTDVRGIIHQLIGISLLDQTSLMRTTIRIMGTHIVNTQSNHSIETMDIGLEMDISRTRMETVETLETFLVLHLLKGEISHRTLHIANQEVINLTILLSADLIIDRLVVSHLTNKNSHKTITRHQSMWFASLQRTIALTNYQTFAS